jgi:mannose-6-phosphate isomerase-like protein (cupin superfamily)
MMKSITSIFAVLILGSAIQAQEYFNVDALKNVSPEHNVKVHSLCSDSYESSYIIWVQDSVKPHYHKQHTELIYVLEGKGRFFIGDTSYLIRPGDYLRIPQGKIHSFKNNTENEVKVISIQTPEFKGKDRIWVEKQH